MTAPWWVPSSHRFKSEAARWTRGIATCAGSPLTRTYRGLRATIYVVSACRASCRRRSASLRIRDAAREALRLATERPRGRRDDLAPRRAGSRHGAGGHQHERHQVDETLGATDFDVWT